MSSKTQVSESDVADGGKGKQSGKKGITIIRMDVIMESIGSLGKYQMFLVAIIYYVLIPNGMNQVGSVFLAAVPNHRCRVAGVDDIESVNNHSYQEKESNFTCIIPRTENGKYDSCSRCNASLHNCSSGCSLNADQIVTCDDEYVFDQDEFTTTIITEWNLVCDRLTYATVIQTVFFFGVLVGSLFAGNMSDRFGRTIVVTISQICIAIFGFGSAYAPNMIIFATMRFFTGIFTMAGTIAAFVYSIEMIGQEWRTAIGVYVQAAFATGYIILSGLSYRLRSWRDLQLAIAITSLPFLFLWLCFPKSPRWLFSKGRNKEGKEISNRMAKRNGRTITEDTWQEASKGGKPLPTRHYQPLELYKRPYMRRVTNITTLLWFTTALVYYGLTLNTGSLTGDGRLNLILGGICEMLCCPLTLICFKFFGRRTLMCTTLLVAGISCIMSTLVGNFVANESAAKISTALALFGKTAISASFAIIYVYTAELYPTVARATAVGVGSMVARIGTCLAPATLQIQNIVPWLTGVIFGVTALISGFACLLLPETCNAPLLTTMEGAERFYERSKRKGVPSKTDTETMQGYATTKGETITML